MSLVRDKNSIVRIIIISIQIANRGKVVAVTSKRREELAYSVTYHTCNKLMLHIPYWGPKLPVKYIKKY